MKCDCGATMECVEDLCGNGTIQGNFKYQINLWADWCPNCREVFFGGYWSEIPPYPSEACPSDDDPPMLAHIKTYEPACEDAYQAWLHSA